MYSGNSEPSRPLKFNAEVFLEVYRNVCGGQKIAPRGQTCIEVTDHRFALSMIGSPLTSFNARELNLQYAKEEFKWYLRADKFDDSIEQHAKLWKKIKQPDDSYYSNYGQYIWPKQFDFVVRELTADPESRRASIVLLKEEHLFQTNMDVVCTYAINFRIRNGYLDMTVMMRSNDVIWGMTNDVFCFSMLYRMVFAMMSRRLSLTPGSYTHFVNSLHVYERHFHMIEQIIADGMKGYEHVSIPWPTYEEVVRTLDEGYHPRNGVWSEWLW